MKLLAYIKNLQTQGTWLEMPVGSYSHGVSGVSKSNLIIQLFRSFDLLDLMGPLQESGSVPVTLGEMGILFGDLNDRGGSDCCRCGCICLGVSGQPSTVFQQCRLELSILGLAGFEGIGHGSRLIPEEGPELFD